MSTHAGTRSSRNRWTLIALAPGMVIAITCFARSAWCAFVKDHPTWDDHLLVGVAWLLAAVGTALLVRLVWAVAAPERWLPRWLAVTTLALATIAGLLVLLWLAYASAWGP